MDSHGKMRYWLDENNEGMDRDNEFFQVFVSAGYLVGKAMNFGISDVLPGSIRWKDNSFDAGLNVDNVKITGSIVTNEKDQPKRVDWTREFNKTLIKCRTDYEYGDQLPNYIPRLSTLSIYDGTKYSPVYEVEISKLILADSPMGNEFFPIDHYLTNRDSLLFYTNHTLMFYVPNGNILTSTSPQEAHYKSRSKVVFGIIALCNGLILVAFLVSRKIRKKEKQ
jgi:hypothetical protein